MFSASVSASSSSSTGPVQFGNIKSGSIGTPAWVYVVVAVVALVGFIGYLATRKKSK